MRILPFLFAPLPLLFNCTLAVSQPATEHAQASAQPSADTCAALATFAMPNAHITSAKSIDAGAFVAKPSPFTKSDLTALYKYLPAFCRVVAQATPTSDSNITIEVWLPLAGWNGKFQGLGNGGFAGVIDPTGLAASVLTGYAAAATDDGHVGSPIDASWALGHPEKVIDFGNRAVHEMTRVAKLVAQQFYGSAPKRSYFDGCSDGGREALMEAQRYPADYDGILAGAPANDWTHLLTTAVVDTQALTATPASFIPQAKIPTIAHAVVAACDALDGVTDGILNDPRQCHFDPASIQCKEGEDTEKCLTAPQVTALNTIYAGLHDAAGHVIFPGYLPGAEEGTGGWGTWITGPAPARSAMAFFGIGYYSNMVYENSDWTYKSFTMDAGFQKAKQKTAAALDSANPDLSAFRARGDKLILYHGWNDPAIPALSTVHYYNSVIAKLGQANADSFVRLYMLPGVQHCGGGPGPSSFGQFPGWPAQDPQHNARIALENWVEKGIAPTTFIATKNATDDPRSALIMTRPLCPYPQSAKYKGTGDPNSADSFECVTPKK